MGSRCVSDHTPYKYPSWSLSPGRAFRCQCDLSARSRACKHLTAGVRPRCLFFIGSSANPSCWSRSCFLLAGWRTKSRLYQRIRLWETAACCRTTGGLLGFTAWMADITSRSSPMGQCRARGMTGTFTVRLQHTAHFTSRSGLQHDAFTSFYCRRVRFKEKGNRPLSSFHGEMWQPFTDILKGKRWGTPALHRTIWLCLKFILNAVQKCSYSLLLGRVTYNCFIINDIKFTVKLTFRRISLMYFM